MVISYLMAIVLTACSGGGGGGESASSPSAICVDGSLSYSQTCSGTCSSHGGVATWYNNCGGSSQSQDFIAPSIPASLIATAVSQDQIDLSWSASNDNVGVSGYKIYREGAFLKSSPSTAASNAGLNLATQYCYQVTAYDATGNESAKGAQACATTAADSIAPSVPANFTASAVSQEQINLSWSASYDAAGVSGYKIYRGGGYLKSLANTSSSDAGLSVATQYCYQVTAYDATGNESGTGPQACATTFADSVPPSVPASLTTTAVSSNRILIAWTESMDTVGVVGYKIYRDGVLLESVAEVTPKIDKDLSGVTSYCYQVTAYDVAGNESAKSTQACATTLAIKLPDTKQTTSYTPTFGEDNDYTINAPSFTDNFNGTVTDNVTGLMWQQQDDGILKMQSDAITYCDDLSLDGHSDWWLPTMAELNGVVHYGENTPSIDGTYFMNTKPSEYWSSDSTNINVGYPQLKGCAVKFLYGGTTLAPNWTSYYARCVRGTR